MPVATLELSFFSFLVTALQPQFEVAFGFKYLVTYPNLEWYNYCIAAKKALQGSGDKAQALERLFQGLQEDTTGGGSEQQPGSSSSNTQNVASSLPDSPASTDLSPRDEEMEEDIARNITGDPLAEYDIEVDKEGNAISEYLGLLKSTTSQQATV